MSSTQPCGRVIIVTGLSGSGKSIAIRQLEDSGYYCIDNLPSDFLSTVISDLAAHGCVRMAVSIDARSQLNLDAARVELEKLKHQGFDVRVLFLTASTPELVQRFSETRRRHPLTIVNGSALTLSEAIGREREILEPAAQFAQYAARRGAGVCRGRVFQHDACLRELCLQARHSGGGGPRF